MYSLEDNPISVRITFTGFEINLMLTRLLGASIHCNKGERLEDTTF
jgi:hypothetical protein